MFMQNFSSLASAQTDLDKFWTFFQEKFKIFFENLEFSKSEKVFNIDSQKASFTHFEPSSIF
jgi:hypothetical protein